MTPAPLTPATFHILLTLAEGSAHGYAIKRAVESRTAGRVRLGPGTLYAALARLVDQRLVRPEAPDRDARVTSGPPAPVYGLTADGRTALTAEIERLEHDARAARGVLKRAAGRGSTR